METTIIDFEITEENWKSLPDGKIQTPNGKSVPFRYQGFSTQKSNGRELKQSIRRILNQHKVKVALEGAPRFSEPLSAEAVPEVEQFYVGDDVLTGRPMYRCLAAHLGEYYNITAQYFFDRETAESWRKEVVDYLTNPTYFKNFRGASKRMDHPRR